MRKNRRKVFSSKLSEIIESLETFTIFAT